MKLAPTSGTLAAAVVLTVCAGYHLATRQPAAEAAGASGTAGEKMISERIVSPATARPESAMPRRAPRDSRPDAQGENRLGIPSSYLREAHLRVGERISRMGHDLAVLQDAGYEARSRSSGDPSKKLGLRLGLEAEVVEKLGGILAADRERRAGHHIAAEKARLEHLRALAEKDRGSYADYLALESMLSRGRPLSGEQEEFYKKFRQSLAVAAGSGTMPDDREWHQKPELLAEMSRHLSPDEQAGLRDFVAEQQARESERQEAYVRMRSGVIADRLGLDEAERATLQDYLRRNPDASSEAIKEILAPELRELLPPGL